MTRSGVSVGRRLVFACLPDLATLVGLASSAAPASAFGEHAFSASFGGAGSGAGEFDEPAGVAVNESSGEESSGEVYVVDKGNGRVEAFNTKHEFLLEFNGGGTFPNEEGAKAPAVLSAPEWVAVDSDPSSPSFGDVYVTDSEAGHPVIDKFTATGAYLGQLSEDSEGERFSNLLGVAVSAAGTLWVYDKEQGPAMIETYSDALVNVLVSHFQSPLAGYGPGFAVDGENDSYAAHGAGVVGEFDGSGKLIRAEVDGEAASAVAVERLSGEAYVDNGSSVAAFSAAGEPLERFGAGRLRQGSGVAVSSVTGVVLVADALADVVDVFSPLHQAGVSGEQAVEVEATAASLQARIDPNGVATSYHFEYDTTPYTAEVAHGTSVPVPAVSIGAGASAVAVSVRLEGLAPGSSYYYRVVAESEAKPGEVTDIYGPDGLFATGALPGSAVEGCANAGLRVEQPFGVALPDCRAFEMVSPLEKSDNGIAFSGARAAVSDESPAVTYFSPGSFAGSGGEPRGAALVSRYLSRRGPEGWSTRNITPPYHTFLPQTWTPFSELLFTPDLSEGVLFDRFTPLVSGEPDGYVNLYLAATDAGTYHSISDVTPPETERKPYEEREGGTVPETAGASTDLSHVVFQQTASLTAGASPNHHHVYEWAGGALSEVDVAPEGQTLEGSDVVGASAFDAEVRNFGDPWHAVSADGSRVFFTGEEHQSEMGQLYVRENPMRPPVGESDCGVVGDACTVEVSRSQRSPEDPNGPRPAFYRGASADGSMVFFTSRAELTSDAYTGPADSAANLYGYDVETKELSDLTVDSKDPRGAGVLGLVTAAEDGSYVYFVANGVLSETANSEGAKATPGNCREEEEQVVVGERTCNLYVEHDGGSGWEAPRFIATLTGGDHNGEGETQDESDWAGFEYGNLEQDFGPGSHTVRVTPDGTSLAFQSDRRLTGYDNQAAKPGECEADGAAGMCGEVYLFDAVTGKLVCASCDPAGTRPAGPAELGGQEKDPAGHGFLEVSPFYLKRNLSEDGGRLFFQTPDPLVPSDSNARLDVYEWERLASPAETARGENSCTVSSPAFHAAQEGCVLAVSDVTGGGESHFMDASPNGNDVFIATAEELVPSDTDHRVDVYDVRVGGGFPASPPPAVCVNADSCKPPVSPQPDLFGAPASQTLSGPGNAVPVVSPVVVGKPKPKPRCKKGFTRRHNRCVRHRTAKRRVKKSAKGRG